MDRACAAVVDTAAIATISGGRGEIGVSNIDSAASAVIDATPVRSNSCVVALC